MHTGWHGHEEAEDFNGINALLEDDTSNYLVVMSDQSSTKCMSCASSLASQAEVKNCGIARAQHRACCLQPQCVQRTGMQVRSETPPWMQKHQQHSPYGNT